MAYQYTRKRPERECGGGRPRVGPERNTGWITLEKKAIKLWQAPAGGQEQPGRASVSVRRLWHTRADTEEKGRSASFFQMDQSNIFSSLLSDSIELMNVGAALEKHHWLKDYFWNAVKPDTDKYTAKTALVEEETGTKSGYFIRSLPNTHEILPVQACMFIGDEAVMQTSHNIVIAEENSELHLITGCATGDDVLSALHVGITEVYLKPGSKLTFTMVHNWAEQVEVRPRTGIRIADNATYLNNYILTSPVHSIQSRSAKS